MWILWSQRTDCGGQNILPLLILHPNFQKLNITLYSKIVNINLHVKGCDNVKDIWQRSLSWIIPTPWAVYSIKGVFTREKQRGFWDDTHRRQGGDSGMIEAENGLMWPQAKGRLQTSGLEESRNSLWRDTPSRWHLGLWPLNYERTHFCCHEPQFCNNLLRNS